MLVGFSGNQKGAWRLSGIGRTLDPSSTHRVDREDVSVLQTFSNMARKNVPISKIFPYHINARTVNRERFPIPLEEVWEIMELYLWYLTHIYEINIFAFVLMPNHFHLLLQSPEGNLSIAMNHFMGETSRRISERAGRINQIYGSRHYKTLIESAHYFKNAYKYVYRNPVKAGLAQKVEDYTYSTLGGVLGKGKVLIPTLEDTQLFNPDFDEHQLAWLNTKPELQNDIAVKLALRRSTFKFPRHEKTKLAHPLETELL